MNQKRLGDLKNTFEDKGVDAFLVTDLLNIYYMSGFRTDVSSLLVTRQENFIITDFRYKEDAERIPGFKVKLVTRGLKGLLIKTLKDSNIKTLGFEADNLSYGKALAFNRLLKKERIKFEPLSGVVEELRLYKSESEINEIRKAIAISKKAFNALKNKVKPGITEKRLSLILENLIRDNGGDAGAFETIIAAGENSSRPHAYITDRKIKNNEHLLIDFGVKINAYNCDLTRVLFLGKIQKLLKDIYGICRDAQRRAIDKVKPGAAIEEVDRAARGYIAGKGFGGFFGHSLGHGIGLAVHELPRIYPKSNKRLKQNMVFTIEPGIYLKGTGGVRIEDMVLVTKKGCEVLTDGIPK